MADTNFLRSDKHKLKPEKIRQFAIIRIRIQIDKKIRRKCIVGLNFHGETTNDLNKAACL